jgi:selenide,water dikinase
MRREDDRPREVVLVGGGHAHVQVLRAFAADPLPNSRLTVLVDRPVALYSGMVPGFVAGQYRADELEIDVRPLARLARARFVETRAVRIDAANRRIEGEDQPPVRYDVASFNIGSTVPGLDVPGIREHALPARPIGVFVERVDEIVARARRHEPGTPFQVVVIGGGAGGVELAFTFHERLRREAEAQVRVSLVESGSRILAGYPTSLIRRVERRSAARGIAIHCNREVIAADCATLIDHPKTPKAGVYAVREGPYIATNIRASLAGRRLRAYRPQGDFLTLLNLGDGTALGTKWGRSFAGRWVMALKDRIDRRFMRRFQVER